MRLRTARKIIKQRKSPFFMYGETGCAVIEPYTRKQTLAAYKRVVKANKKSVNKEMLNKASIYWRSTQTL